MDVRVLQAMIGVPFVEKGRDRSGWDCWGCVRWGMQQGFGIEVPSYAEDYVSSREGEEVSALIGRESLGWLEVPLAEAQPGDVVILRMQGRPWHCGLVLEPPYFLHADRCAGTVRERWDASLWAKRIAAVYRHRQRVGVRTAAGVR